MAGVGGAVGGGLTGGIGGGVSSGVGGGGGGVVSPAAGVVALALADCAETFPAASYAATV